MNVLVIDGANVVGSRPDGWWRDRAGAARRLAEALETAQLSYDRVVLVLEGAAKAGVRAGRDAHVRAVHAPRDGDSEIRRQADAALGAGHRVAVVTADRVLAANVTPAQVLSPSWLLDRV